MLPKMIKYCLVVSGAILVMFLANWTVISSKLSFGSSNHIQIDQTMDDALSEASERFLKKACENDK